MSTPNGHSTSALRLADRLAAARQQAFVGRASELELFRSVLLKKEPPIFMLHIYGPGGIGKTALLGEYARLAAEAGVPAVLIDGREFEPSPSEFLAALRSAMGIQESVSPFETFYTQPRPVMLIDTAEAIAPLDVWLRETFLPQLPQESLVVIAGRNPPAPAWRTDPGWRSLSQIVPLRNFSPEESRVYLSARGVPRDQQPSALDFTHGHPLGLALAAEVLAQEPVQASLDLQRRPDVVQTLLERFVALTPRARHRQALQVCAHVRVTTEALLTAVLDTADPQEVHQAFEWLRGLSFLDQGPDGVFPHDLAREVLEADFRWRNPDGYLQMHRRVVRYLWRKLQESRGADQQRVIFDKLYLHRHHPMMRPYFDWQGLGGAFADSATSNDYPLIIELVERYEGEESAEVARYWLQRQPQAFTVFRSAGSDLVGFVATLAIHQATPEDLEADPAVRAAWGYAQEHGPARPGEEMIYHRFWSGRETYQTAASQNFIATTANVHWVGNPKLAWCFAACADPDFWSPFLSYVDLHRAPEAEFKVGGKGYGVFVHDWRAVPVLDWFDLVAERQMAIEPKPESLSARRPDPLIVLSLPDFEKAVRQALREFTRPTALATNPLLHSRLLSDAARQEPSPKALQDLVRQAAESLRSNPRDDRLYRALWRTYLEPAGTRERAAELLDLPFSTYRHHLTDGIQRVVQWLWERELGATQS